MSIRLITSISTLDPDAWSVLESLHFPFTDYAFLKVLEDSGSIGPGTGWHPAYLLYEDAQGLQGALCSYAKSHSYGEYIFDWEWAHFFRESGVPYYPKLLTAIPFTPATGPRLLLRADADRQKVGTALIEAAIALAQNSKMSSYHALFIEENETEAFAAASMCIRHSMQFHWRNQNYRDFGDYLAAFVGKRRRDITRERQRAQAQGLEIACVNGAALTHEHAEAMERLYLTTAEKKDAIPYLRSGFFAQLFAAMPENILLVTARDGADIVAASLNLWKGQSLFGRYWGCERHYPDLHFELCYYQAIDFAISRGITLFEAGAQGEHKIQRGFLPSLTRSAHLIFSSPFRKPIEQYITEERRAIDKALADYAGQGPFKSTNAK